MPMSPRVAEVECIGARQLRVTFTDGLVRELDFAGVLVGIFASIDEDVAFAEVGVDAIAGTVCWPGGLDLDPDVLHGDHEPATGMSPSVIGEHQPQDAPS